MQKTSSLIRISFFASLMASALTLAIILAMTTVAYGQAIEVTDQAETPPRVGRKAAQKYMGEKPAESSGGSRKSSGGGYSGDHYLAIHLGTFVSDKAYKWGMKDEQSDVGDTNIGLTYRVGEWVNSMDLGVRVDYLSYGLDAGRASKLSFMPIVTFPDASARFPLYFGAGAGLGIFLNQLGGESAISFDYTLFGGIRFFEVFQNTGFFLEAGLKNQINLASDGQFNGTFVTLGPVFTF